MSALVEEIVRDPLSSLVIVANLFLIESLLSVDNAAVLATMVMGLPRKERVRALKYGIIGAYLFRGICLVLATYLVKIWWLKGAGGLYLVYLCLNWWIKKSGRQAGHHAEPRAEKKLYSLTVGRLGRFWATVISVEIMDLAFSLDNVFAAVAYSQNILIILTGVFIGILAMRFVAQGFVKLMERYAFLEGCAFTVIGLLGFKLAFSFYAHFYPAKPLTVAMEGHTADWITSLGTIAVFFVPLATSMLFNFPSKEKKASNSR
jgi:YkoY family integral membrane protein